MPFELQLVAYFQSVALFSPWTISLAVFLARWLILAFIPLAVFSWYRGKDGRHAVAEAAWALCVALLITTVVSALVLRPRPFMVLIDGLRPIVQLIPPPLNHSFPSGHTAAAAAMAAALLFVDRRVGTAAVFVAALVAFGRIFVGVHYPTDIFAGLCVGMFAFAIVRFCHGQLRRRDILNKRHV